MGGAVKSIGNLVGGVGGLASGAVSRIPGIGPIAGPIVGGITGGPAGFASSLASNALSGNYGGGGGGGSSGGTSSTPMYAQPNISYGNTTYQSGNNPIDASKYFITGDRGVYNLLPALGQVTTGSGGEGNRLFMGDRMTKAGVYTPYEAYNDIRTQMANDPKALAAFNAAYQTTPYKMDSLNGMGGFPGRRGVVPFDMNAYTASNPFPYQNVDFGLKGVAVPGTDTMDALKYKALAGYAAENKNPFFMPFQTTQGATAMGFTPSAAALAADTAIKDYRKNLNAAQYNYYQNAPKLPRTPNLEDLEDDDRRGFLPRPGTTTGTGTTIGTGTGTVTPNPVPPRPNNNDNDYNRPRPVTPPPVAPPPVAPPPVTPPPGQFTPMRRGGIAMLNRRR